MSITLRENAPQGASVGFNGELHESSSHWQILGNGYRAFNPVLMRFHSPDNLSPFQQGGDNAYAYARTNPVNFVDPSGHFALSVVIGALALTAGTGVGALAAHFSGEKELAGVLGAVTLGFATISAMAVAGYMIPKGLSPKAHGQEPRSVGKDLARGDMRVFRTKDGTHVLEMHGKPGVGQLDGRRVGPKAVAKRFQELKGDEPLTQVQMQVCYGADKGVGGMPPLAQGVSRELGVPVMAFEGQVTGVGKRLTYKIGYEHYFFPNRRPVRQIGSGQRNPWRLGKPQFSRRVRELRNSSK